MVAGNGRDIKLGTQQQLQPGHPTGCNHLMLAECASCIERHTYLMQQREPLQVATTPRALCSCQMSRTGSLYCSAQPSNA